jgi:hypothetical protein
MRIHLYINAEIYADEFSEFFRECPSLQRLFAPTVNNIYLEGESISRAANNRSLDIPTADLGIGIWNSPQCAGRSSVTTVTEIIIDGDSPSIIVLAKDWFLGTDKLVRLNEDLSTEAGINAIPCILKVAVINMASTESQGWGTGV